MTLEHIGQTQRFLAAVRAVANRSDSVIFFQVPDMHRILKEGAFWDIYYEHCSYFSKTSLTYLFTGTGFAVQRIWTGYDAQYLMIVASPMAPGSASQARDEKGVAAIIDLCGSFVVAASHSRAAWLRRLHSWASAGQRTVLWGSGSKAVAFLTTLGVHDQIEYVVDINPNMSGHYLAKAGLEIVSPSVLYDYRPDVVIVMNPVYLREIRAELTNLGLNPDVMST